ncbi:MAG: hypothetical protein AB7U73_15325 [Pirellulales bacterium]
MLATLLRNLQVQVNNALSKKQQHPIEVLEAHPFRKRKNRGLRITPENFGSLRQVVTAMHGRRRR